MFERERVVTQQRVGRVFAAGQRRRDGVGQRRQRDFVLALPQEVRRHLDVQRADGVLREDVRLKVSLGEVPFGPLIEPTAVPVHSDLNQGHARRVQDEAEPQPVSAARRFGQAEPDYARRRRVPVSDDYSLLRRPPILRPAHVRVERPARRKLNAELVGRAVEIAYLPDRAVLRASAQREREA